MDGIVFISRAPFIKLLHDYTPSINLANIDVGAVFLIDKRRYLLLHRDPWKASLIRYTWFDDLSSRLSDWVSERFKR